MAERIVKLPVPTDAVVIDGETIKPLGRRWGLAPPMFNLDAAWSPEQERLHPRDPGGEGGGRFVRKSVSVLAGGFADAARIVADAYSAKGQRELDSGLAGISPWLAGGAREPHPMGLVEAYSVDWDTGRRMVLLSSSMSPDRGGAVGYIDEPGTVEKLRARAQQMVDAWKATTLETQRKQLRGAIAADKGEDGKRAYRAVREALAQNESLPGYESLRERFPDVSDNMILVAEKGYGRGIGIEDVLVTASRNLNSQVTSINALAMSVHQRFADADPHFLEGPYGPHSVKPGDSFVGTRDPATTLRHEWAHGLWDALSDGQRAEFIGLLPGWDAIAAGLSKYAAGDPEARLRYAQFTNPGKDGYYTETFAEAVALVTGPHYQRDVWPDWVGRLADWIGTVKPK